MLPEGRPALFKRPPGSHAERATRTLQTCTHLRTWACVKEAAAMDMLDRPAGVANELSHERVLACEPCVAAEHARSQANS